MAYATGGVAYTGYDFEITSTVIPDVPDPVNGTMVGWTVGGGVEYAINDNWRVRGNYQFSDYGDKTVRAYYSTIVSYDELKIDLKTHTVTVGVSFNW